MINKNGIILPDVSLCAIVRDEKMNPAGGIERFVASHVPFVEEAVIVDTGSLDGTREILEKLEGEFKNLKIYDHKFNGFADARNYSLSKVKTKYALVLDADELITHEKPSNDWKIIHEKLKLGEERYNIQIKSILPNGREKIFEEVHGGRLSITSKMRYKHSLFECMTKDLFLNESFELKFCINHFVPSRERLEKKVERLYVQNPINFRFGMVDVGNFEKEIINKNIAPSQIPGFTEWKSYNPQRDNYE